jgi:hypothetical protein
MTVEKGLILVAKKMCVILRENGKGLIITLDNKKFESELWINLLGIGKALQKGFNLGSDGEIIKLTKGSVTFTFNENVRTKIGYVP